jgi:hypothetical protein
MKGSCHRLATLFGAGQRRKGDLRLLSTFLSARERELLTIDSDYYNDIYEYVSSPCRSYYCYNSSCGTEFSLLLTGAQFGPDCRRLRDARCQKQQQQHAIRVPMLVRANIMGVRS